MYIAWGEGGFLWGGFGFLAKKTPGNRRPRPNGMCWGTAQMGKGGSEGDRLKGNRKNAESLLSSSTRREGWGNLEWPTLYSLVQP